MGNATASARVVERYLKCLADHDWDSKAHYVAYLRKILTQLKGHRLDVQRVSRVDDRLSYVELTEAFEMDWAMDGAIDGVTTEWPGCILFEQRDDGLISRVSVFFKLRPANSG
jgi:hypothetical protein